MRVTVLGCGGSGGVPLLGPFWGACDPGNPRNRRRRVSIAVRQGDTTILVDTSPDLRAQCLDAGIAEVSAILYTHDHADHTQGIDDVRFLKRPKGGAMIPAYGSSETLHSLVTRFGYIFEQRVEGSSHLYKPFLEARLLKGRIAINGVMVTPFAQDHGYGTQTTGFRIGNIAYSTDVVDLPESSFRVLEGLDLWIVDCLRFEPHTTHAHFDKAVSWIARVKPKQAILTHMNHQVDYETILNRCPAGVVPAHDGLEVEVPDVPLHLKDEVVIEHDV